VNTSARADTLTTNNRYSDQGAGVLPDLAQELEQRIIAAVSAAYGITITAEQAVIRPAAPGRRADYQSNAAMPLAKQLNQPSRHVAEQIAAHLDTTGLAQAEVAGPGFINLAFTDEHLADAVAALAADPRLGLPVQPMRRVLIDYSSPNMAKEMHVGHLRSTIIGDALVRIFEELGHEVVRQNHLGDWGTQFGMLVEYMVAEGLAGEQFAVADLTGFYTSARARFNTDEAFAERARKRVVLLQAGDPDTLALWRQLLTESQRHMEQVYAMLGVRLTPADYQGESSYNPVLADVADELTAKGLAVTSDGALCVFPRGFTGRDGNPMPLIVRKSDGGYGYDATDLATIRYRTQELKGDDLLYVVGSPQALHFELIFTTAREANWLPPDATTAHVKFGSVLGADGKILRTRDGVELKLIDLLTEAVQRAHQIVAERSELNPVEQQRIARAVGIGAVKYADLSTHRDKDYVFDWNRMLAMDGNTAVYLQYAYARIRSMLRKSGRPTSPGSAVVITTPPERDLALKLSQYPAAVQAAAQHYEPHRLCGYLYDLAAAFTGFYENCPVLAAPTEQLRGSRLALADHTARILAHGLTLLGIQAPERL
jgi:arginyl-tRNA synthetase